MSFVHHGSIPYDKLKLLKKRIFIDLYCNVHVQVNVQLNNFKTKENDTHVA